uniref:Uncharacterized protein n=1 Tax=Arundo donax TaxID=35708 RepID=A0A0A9F3Y0_ARUDO
MIFATDYFAAHRWQQGVQTRSVIQQESSF